MPSNTVAYSAHPLADGPMRTELGPVHPGEMPAAITHIVPFLGSMLCTEPSTCAAAYSVPASDMVRSSRPGKNPGTVATTDQSSGASRGTSMTWPVNRSSVYTRLWSGLSANPSDRGTGDQFLFDVVGGRVVPGQTSGRRTDVRAHVGGEEISVRQPEKSVSRHVGHRADLAGTGVELRKPWTGNKVEDAVVQLHPSRSREVVEYRIDVAACIHVHDAGGSGYVEPAGSVVFEILRFVESARHGIDRPARTGHGRRARLRCSGVSRCRRESGKRNHCTDE